MTKMFRQLYADEIDVRVQQSNANGCSLLLYKDARCDMHILDETVGPDKWQRKHYECKGTLFCSVGVLVGGEWVWKDDGGAPSNMAKEKGEASDSFKRACTNWGIGRELYTAPFIWIPAKDKDGLPNYSTRKNDASKIDDIFSVSWIEYTDGRISSFGIRNKSRKLIYKKGREPEEKTKVAECPQCHHVVLPARGKDGEIKSGPDILEALKDVCPDCYKKNMGAG